ncbi:MAG: hypothetical protein R3208_11450 [Ketobacteraceae bacterium]|nr:hypothetical protein [Ketobacteraceae bacterium]
MSEAGYVEQNVGKNKDAIYYDDGRDRTLSSKEAERRQLEEAMASFLSSGGTIKAIEPNVRADPPRKPESNYGSRPI